jgi:hypothetical protein
MSNLTGGQIAGGVIGGVIGFFAGGPIGAFKGAAIGLSLGGYIDPPRGPNLRGPTLDDNSFQSTSYGVALARLYGRIAGYGNVIYLENNKYKSVSKKSESGGKGGGGGQTVTTTTYYATFAVALGCAYPNSVIYRMWAGGKLIVGPTGAQKGLTYKYYDGTQTTADPRMEAVLGMGNVPSYEGTAYVIFYDFELTQYGNSLAGCPIKVELFDPSVSEQYNIENYFLQNSALYPTQPQPFSDPACSLPSGGGGLPLIYAVDSVGERYYTATGSGGVVVNTNDQILQSGLKMHCPPTGQPGAELKWGYPHVVIPLGLGPLLGIRTNAGNFTSPLFKLPGTEEVCIISESSFVYGIFKTGSEGLPPTIPPYTMFLFRFGATSPSFFIDYISVFDPPGNIALKDGFFYHLHYAAGFSEIRFKKIRLSDGVIIYDQLIPYLPIWGDPGFSIFGEIFNGKFYRYHIDAINLLLAVVTLDIVTFEQKVKTFSINDLGDNPSSASSANNITVNGGVISCSCLHITGGGIDPYIFGVKVFTVAPDNADSISRVSVDSIIEQEAALVGIAAANLDLSEIVDDKTIGYRVGELGSFRAAVGALQSAYLFDFVEQGYTIKAVKRGKNIFYSAPWQNMIMEDGTVVKREWDSPVLMPSQMTINYIDFDREFDAGSQYATHQCNFQNEVSQNLAVVLRANEAIQLADIFIKAAWAERIKFPRFSLPWSYDYIEGDQLNLEYSPGRFQKVRIESRTKNELGYYTFSACSTSELAYQSNALGSPGDTGSIIDIPTYSDPLPVVLDIPMIDQAQDVFGLTAVIAQAEPSTQVSLVISADGGINFTEIARADGPGVVGQAINMALGGGDQFVVERGTTLAVDNILSGEFFSVTYEQMLRNRNLIAYGQPGRWEILTYQDATPTGVGSAVVLSTFIRGMFGTEQYMDDHALNDFVVLLDHPNAIFAPVPQQAFGQSWPIKAVNVGDDIDDGITANYGVYMAVNLKPLSVVDAEANRVGNDWVIDFDPRTRYQSTQWVTGAVEQNDTQYYSIDVIGPGDSIKRTIESPTIQLSYTEAQQIADFGSAQTTITIDIYQVNQRVGRGYPLRVTA